MTIGFLSVKEAPIYFGSMRVINRSQWRYPSHFSLPHMQAYKKKPARRACFLIRISQIGR